MSKLASEPGKEVQNWPGGGAKSAAVPDADQALARFRVLLSKLVRVPKKALDAKLVRTKRRKSASKD
jgi:hypothetical protein